MSPRTGLRRRVAAALFVALSSVPQTLAHGQIKGIMANGVYTQGPNIYWAEDSVNSDTAVRKMYQAGGPSYVLPQDFGDSSKMACEGSAGAPQLVSVTSGTPVRVDWVGATGELAGKPGTGNVPSGQYPWVHAMGTVASYIAECTNGDCQTFDASKGSWVKLSMFGIDQTETISDDLRATMKGKPEEYYPTSGSGLWGMARFVEAGSSWTVTIPAQLKPGQYLLRQELGAVHNPWNAQDSTSGTQMYIGCTQLNVIGNGKTTLPAGTLAGSLYKPNGAFARYNVYADNGRNFVDPGPALWNPSASAKRHESNSTSEALRLMEEKHCEKHERGAKPNKMKKVKRSRKH